MNQYNNSVNTITLNRDCEAILIPGGDAVRLERGTQVLITQALGGTVTVRTDMGLFRIGTKDLDALGISLASDSKGCGEGCGCVDKKTVDCSAEAFNEEQVWQALKECFDPEIPINIVDLGLIYDVRCMVIEETGQYTVAVKMTLTAQGCGMGPTIAADAKEKIEQIPQVQEATVDVVWDPVWTPHMISADGRKALQI